MRIAAGALSDALVLFPQACPTCGLTVRCEPQVYSTVGGGTGEIMPRRSPEYASAVDDSAHAGAKI